MGVLGRTGGVRLESSLLVESRVGLMSFPVGIGMSLWEKVEE